MSKQEEIEMKLADNFVNPTYNLEISFGGGRGEITISQNVRRTLLNRFRYWMLCKFFPFQIERWE